MVEFIFSPLYESTVKGFRKSCIRTPCFIHLRYLFLRCGSMVFSMCFSQNLAQNVRGAAKKSLGSLNKASCAESSVGGGVVSSEFHGKFWLWFGDPSACTTLTSRNLFWRAVEFQLEFWEFQILKQEDC